MAQKTRILIVEDDTSLAEVLTYNLKQTGYEVLLARDGREVAVGALLAAKRIRKINPRHSRDLYSVTSWPICLPISSAVSARRSCTVSGSTNPPRPSSQLSLKLVECAEIQICRTGEFGLKTNFPGGSSNSTESAPAWKSGSKS